MQDAPFFIALKSEFIGEITNSTFLSSLSVADSYELLPLQISFEQKILKSLVKFSLFDL